VGVVVARGEGAGVAVTEGDGVGIVVTVGVVVGVVQDDIDNDSMTAGAITTKHAQRLFELFIWFVMPPAKNTVLTFFSTSDCDLA